MIWSQHEKKVLLEKAEKLLGKDYSMYETARLLSESYPQTSETIRNKIYECLREKEFGGIQ